jgi:molybdopterin molybdotransferase
MSTELVWTRIIKAVEVIAPNKLHNLNDGASNDDIHAVEKELQISFPDDYRESLKIHDGEKDSGIVGGPWELTSLDKMIREWKVWQTLRDDGTLDKLLQGEPRNPKTKYAWVHAKWIPICVNGGGDSYFLDLDPGPTGTLGQIIKHSHEIGTEKIVAPNYTKWLEAIAKKLEKRAEKKLASKAEASVN